MHFLKFRKYSYIISNRVKQAHALNCAVIYSCAINFMRKFVQSHTESSISLQPVLSLLLPNFIHKYYKLWCLLSYVGIRSSDKIANVTFRLYYGEEAEYPYNEKSFSRWNIVFQRNQSNSKTQLRNLFWQ